jgi:chorismate-pyruvate lyase
MAAPQRRIWQSLNWSNAYYQLSNRQGQWLLHTHSLTRALKQLCASQGAQFRLHIHHQGLGRLRQDELRLRTHSRAKWAYLREVTLYCGSTPMIHARSWMEIGPHKHPFSPFKRAGAKPLGEILFAKTTHQRKSFEIARRPRSQTWSRRSSFHWPGYTLFLEEAFLEIPQHEMGQKTEQ